MPSDGNCGLHELPISCHDQHMVLKMKRRSSENTLFLTWKSTQQWWIMNYWFTRNRPTTLDDYLNKQSVNGCWVDEMMLSAASLCVGRDTHILHTTKLEQELQTHGSLFLGLIGEHHFANLHLQCNDCNLTQTYSVSEPVYSESNESAVSESIGHSGHKASVTTMLLLRLASMKQ